MSERSSPTLNSDLAGEAAVYRFSKARLLFVTVIGLMLPLTLWLAIRFATRGGWGDAVFLGAISIVLGGLDIWVWRRLLSNKAAVILTPDALIDQASLFGAGRLERADILEVAVQRQGFWKMVVVKHRKPGARAGESTAMMPAVLLADSAEVVADGVRTWLQHGRRY